MQRSPGKSSGKFLIGTVAKVQDMLVMSLLFIIGTEFCLRAKVWDLLLNAWPFANAGMNYFAVVLVPSFLSCCICILTTHCKGTRGDSGGALFIFRGGAPLPTSTPWYDVIQWP